MARHLNPISNSETDPTFLQTYVALERLMAEINNAGVSFDVQATALLRMFVTTVAQLQEKGPPLPNLDPSSTTQTGIDQQTDLDLFLQRTADQANELVESFPTIDEYVKYLSEMGINLQDVFGE